MNREQLLARAKLLEKAREIRSRLESQAQSPSVSSSVIQEQAPFIGAKERLVAKNLAKDTASQVAYLKSQFPDKDFAIINDQVVAKEKTDQNWKVLDPNTGFFSKDFFSDVGDVAYDVGAGAAQNAIVLPATAAAALATGGWAALPTAVGLSGTLGAANEAMRQKLGQALGIPQEVSTEDVLTSGAISAVVPALAGVGNLAKTGVAKNITDPKTLQMLAKQGSGVLGRISGAMGKGISSVPKEAIEAYQRYGDVALDAERGGGILQYLKPEQENILKATQQNKSAIGQAKQSLLDQAGGVNISSIKKSILDRIEQLKNTPKELFDTDVKNQIDALEAEYVKRFGMPEGKILGDFIPASKLFEKSKLASEQAEYASKTLDYNKFRDTELPRSFKSQASDILKQAAPGVEELDKKYVKALDLANYSKKFAGTPKNLFESLIGMDTNSKKEFKEVVVPQLKELGLNPEKIQDVATAYKYFAKPSSMPISTGGATSTSFTLNAGELGRGGGKILANAADPNNFNLQNIVGSLGAIASNYAVSPAYTRKVLDAQKYLQKTPAWADALTNPLNWNPYLSSSQFRED